MNVLMNMKQLFKTNSKVFYIHVAYEEMLSALEKQEKALQEAHVLKVEALETLVAQREQEIQHVQAKYTEMETRCNDAMNENTALKQANQKETVDPRMIEFYKKLSGLSISNVKEEDEAQVYPCQLQGLKGKLGFEMRLGAELLEYVPDELPQGDLPDFITKQYELDPSKVTKWFEKVVGFMNTV